MLRTLPYKFYESVPFWLSFFFYFNPQQFIQLLKVLAARLELAFLRLRTPRHILYTTPALRRRWDLNPRNLDLQSSACPLSHTVICETSKRKTGLKCSPSRQGHPRFGEYLPTFSQKGEKPVTIRHFKGHNLACRATTLFPPSIHFSKHPTGIEPAYSSLDQSVKTLEG